MYRICQRIFASKTHTEMQGIINLTLVSRLDEIGIGKVWRRGGFEPRWQTAAFSLSATNGIAPRPSVNKVFSILRTTYGQLRGERKWVVVPKRHQIKHLGFFATLVRDQEVDGSNPFAPTNFFKHQVPYADNPHHKGIAPPCDSRM